MHSPAAARGVGRDRAGKRERPVSRGTSWMVVVGIAAVVGALAFRAGWRLAVARSPVEAETRDSSEMVVPSGVVGPADFADLEQAVPPCDS